MIQQLQWLGFAKEEALLKLMTAWHQNLNSKLLCFPRFHGWQIRSKAVQRFEVFKVWPSYEIGHSESTCNKIKSFGNVQETKSWRFFPISRISCFVVLGAPALVENAWIEMGNQGLKWLAFILVSWNDWVSDTNRFILSISLLTWNEVGLCEVRRSSIFFGHSLLMWGWKLMLICVDVGQAPFQTLCSQPTPSWAPREIHDKSKVGKVCCADRSSLDQKNPSQPSSQQAWQSCISELPKIQVLYWPLLWYTVTRPKNKKRLILHLCNKKTSDVWLKLLGSAWGCVTVIMGERPSLFLPGNTNRKKTRTSRK